MTNLFFRNDTLLGICEGLGEEFGFNANYLRIGLASLLLWNAVGIVGVYLTLGVVLAISRWFWPAQPPVAVVTTDAAPVADNDGAPSALARAA